MKTKENISNTPKLFKVETKVESRERVTVHIFITLYILVHKYLLPGTSKKAYTETRHTSVERICEQKVSGLLGIGIKM